jgi:hypothetical protein
MCLSGKKRFAPLERESCDSCWVYKHLVPLGPKRKNRKNSRLARSEEFLGRQHLRFAGSVLA